MPCLCSSGCTAPSSSASAVLRRPQPDSPALDDGQPPGKLTHKVGLAEKGLHQTQDEIAVGIVGQLQYGQPLVVFRRIVTNVRKIEIAGEQT
jgi:hypothetical protein